MYEVLESLNTPEKSDNWISEDKKFNDESFLVTAFNINMDQINNIEIRNVNGQLIGNTDGSVMESDLQSGISISANGYKTEKYSYAELKRSRGKIILLDQDKKANIKVKDGVYKNSNHFSRNHGTGGIELPESRTSGVGNTSFGMGLEFKDNRSIGGTDYVNMQYNINYGLTSRVDMGLNMADEKVKSSTSQSGINSGYMKYNLGEYEINDIDLNFALGARASSFSDTEIFGILGINRDRNQLNLIAEKKRLTGDNNFGFLVRHELMPLFSSDLIKDNFLIFEMMQDSNDNLSLINLGYRAFLSRWALDVYFKRDMERDIRTSGVGGSISF